jgi:hypothetical protein
MSQQSLWKWREAFGEEGEPAEEPTDGSLDLSELPERTSGRMMEAQRLHRRLEYHLGLVDLVITDNRRRMVSTKSRRGRRQIRLHHMFLGCGTETVTAIVQLTTGDDRSRDHIREYIDENREAIRFEVDDGQLEREGEHFDLAELLEAVRPLVDEEVEEVDITWGRDGRGSKSIRFGSFDFDQRLIRIHPALDQEWVPTFFVEFIVYHELLHAVCPPVDGEETRRIHTREFLEREREFPRYEEAMEWEEENLRRILDRGDRG